MVKEELNDKGECKLAGVQCLVAAAGMQTDTVAQIAIWKWTTAALHLNIQSVPRSKHNPSRLQKPVS